MMLTFRDGFEWVQPQSAAYPSPKACCYFSERELLGLALDSYRAALRGLSPPAGEPWSLEGSAWAGPESFVEGLALELVTRLRRRAYLTGHMIPAQEWSPDDARGAGGTPADMAHGCAAVDAVGPAQGAGQGGDDAATVDPLFVCPLGQELPAVAAAGSRNAALEAARQ